MSKDPRDECYTIDENGETWLIDKSGDYVRDHNGDRLPGPPERKEAHGFTYYDSSRGHCGLCGRLICSGGCFK